MSGLSAKDLQAKADKADKAENGDGNMRAYYLQLAAEQAARFENSQESQDSEQAEAEDARDSSSERAAPSDVILPKAAPDGPWVGLLLLFGLPLATLGLVAVIAFWGFQLISGGLGTSDADDTYKTQRCSELRAANAAVLAGADGGGLGAGLLRGDEMSSLGC